MRKKLSTILTGAVVGMAMIATALVADARPNDQREMHRGKDHRGGKAMMRCLRAAELDEAQKEQVRTIMESSKESHRALREAARADRRAVRELLETDASDAEIGAAVRAAHESAEKVKELREQTHEQIRSLLSADQLLRFEGCASAHHGPRGRHD